MGGFFEREEIEKKSEKIRAKKLGCSVCGLDKGVISPRMKGTGKGKKRILILPEAPGAEEDRRNEQLVGPVGRWTRRKLTSEGIDLNRDCWKINSVNCRPPNNRRPTGLEIKCCRKMVLEEIGENPPHLIIPMGSAAVESLFGERFPRANDTAISRWRGLRIPDRELNAWVCPIFHPGFITKNQGTGVERIFEMDLRGALGALDRPPVSSLPLSLEEGKKRIQILKKESEILSELREILRIQPTNLAFDWETTGLKPHREGHRIVTASMCWQERKAISFEMSSEKVRYKVGQILTHPKIGKMAHHLQFEHLWAHEILKVEVDPWIHDSMLAAHVLDNRRAITGLKFQLFLYLGWSGYEDEIAPFLKSGTNNANDFNRILEAPRDKLLLYGGLDSLGTYVLSEAQKGELRCPERNPQ